MQQKKANSTYIDEKSEHGQFQHFNLPNSKK